MIGKRTKLDPERLISEIAHLQNSLSNLKWEVEQDPNGETRLGQIYLQGRAEKQERLKDALTDLEEMQKEQAMRIAQKRDACPDFDAQMHDTGNDGCYYF